MTLRLKCILAVALVSAVPAALAQQSSGHPSLDRPRSAYDPAAKAGAPASNKSAIGTSLHAVNPQDKDYGEVIVRAGWPRSRTPSRTSCGGPTSSSQPVLC